MPVWGIVLIVFAAVNIFFFAVVVPMYLIPSIVYRVLLVRTKKDKWTRTCSEKDDLEQMDMFDRGIQWGEKYASCRKDVHIVSEGFNLYGQYFDFGAKKAVIVIAGRSEACTYCCYFSEPYRRAGYNVLVVDNRSHGLSDGKYNSVGFKEWVDIRAWAKMLHDDLSNESVICHGICMGSAAALYAMTKPDCPEYMKALVADGMFTTFRESFDNHLVEKKKSKFPSSFIVMSKISRHSGADALRDGPVNYISKLNKPVLFIYSKQDSYSTPDQAEKLFSLANEPKQIVWFDKGVHSHVRINDEKKYDDTIVSFLEEKVSGKN